MEAVKRKGSEDICIFDTPDKKIHYAQHMPSENHISKTLKSELEKWLKIALEWDPKKRGINQKTNELAIFSMLENILSKQIINIFSVYSYQFLSYEIDDSTLISTLQGWIQRDIKIPVEEQFILTFDSDEVQPDDFCRMYYEVNTCRLFMIVLAFTLIILFKVGYWFYQTNRVKTIFIYLYIGCLVGRCRIWLGG